MTKPKHVVGLSGGKDSTALALWLTENEPRDYEFICNETGNELPEMQAHWGGLELVLGSSIKRVRHSVDLLQLCEELGKEFERGRPLRKTSRGVTCRVCSL